MKNRAFVFMFCALTFANTPHSKGSAGTFDTMNKSTVSIKIKSTVSTYGKAGVFTGTGFIVDKKLGFIATNKHIVFPNSVAQYEIKFSNGVSVKAQRYYVDPIHDFAYLKIDPKKIPESCTEVTFAQSGPRVGDRVMMIGSNGGKESSYLEGTISNTLDSAGEFPSKTIFIAFSSKPGSSGSPLFNSNTEVVGIHFGSNFNTTGFALPASYLIDALSYLRKQATPSRYKLGAWLKYSQISKSVEFLKFPQKQADEYNKHHPDAHGMHLLVESVEAGSPADNALKVGDIVLEINDTKQTADLYLFEKAVDESKGKGITLKVVRFGEEKVIKIQPTTFNNSAFNRFVLWAGAVFYEADEYVASLSGIKTGSVVVTNITEGSSIYNSSTYSIAPCSGPLPILVHVTKINDKEIANLNDLIKIIKDSPETKLPFIIKNYMAIGNYNSAINTNRTELYIPVDLTGLDAGPFLFEFDEKTYDWQKKSI